MPRLTIDRHVAAPVAEVFEVVAHIEKYRQAVPHIVAVEFISDVTRGVGTRFVETRAMKGREATTELEVTEYVKDERIRIVADSHGTVWDSVFTVVPAGDGAALRLVMDARAHKLVPKLVNPFLIRLIRGAVGADMDAVKTYCETRGG